MCRSTCYAVIVDAAAQLPPLENLWRFTQMGAALAVFSEGKDLQGPQSSGLVVGRKDLIEAEIIVAGGRSNQIAVSSMIASWSASETCT